MAKDFNPSVTNDSYLCHDVSWPITFDTLFVKISVIPKWLIKFFC